MDLITEYRPIDIITFKINFSLKESKDFISQDDNSTDTQNKTKKLSDQNKEDLFNYLNLPNSEGDYYSFIKRELIRKLQEYGYYVDSLFPDFDDYIKFQARKFGEVDDTHKLNDSLADET